MGYQNGFYLKSPDDKFSLKASGLLQFRYSLEDFDDSQDKSSFQIHRGRLKFAGNAFNPDLKYMMQMETRSTGTKDGSNAVELLDFFADYTKYEKLKFRIGQWKVPFNTQFMTSASKLQFVNRSEADDEFNLGRQIGVMAYGDVLDNKLEYFAGVWNGNFRNEKRNDNNEHLWIGRVAFHPLDHFYGHPKDDMSHEGHTKHYGHYEDVGGDFEYSNEPALLIAASAAFDSVDDFKAELEKSGEAEEAAAGFKAPGLVFEPVSEPAHVDEGDEVDVTRLVAELGFKYKGFSFLTEYYWRKTHGYLDANLLDQGFFAQAGYFLIPKKLEVAGRYSLVDYDNELEIDAIRETTLGVNYFLSAHRHKVQFNTIRIDEEEGNEDNINYNYVIQYQMLF